MGRVYSLSLSDDAIAAAQDLWPITTASAVGTATTGGAGNLLG